MESTNLSAKKREKMLEFLNDLRESNKDDERVLKAINEIESELNNKKYGLVWEEHEEEVDRMLKDNIPVFSEVHDKEINEAEEDCFNFLLEGDNLHSLKLLEKTHKGKVDVIYIDPPYNTGNEDFIYGDKVVGKEDSFKHSKWLSFVERRLYIAKNVLTNEGIILISIDDRECFNLKLLCDEIFGETNYLCSFIRKTKSMTGDDGNGLNIQSEYLLAYAKEKNVAKLTGELKKLDNYSNPDNDPNGEWCSADPSAKSGGDSTYFAIENPFTNKKDYPPKGRYWAFSKKTMKEYIKNGRIVFKKDYNDNQRGFIFKRYKNNLSSLHDSVGTLVFTDNNYMNQNATKEFNNIFGSSSFDYPKPVLYIKKLLQYITKENSIILDFFAGSGTTAQAVLELNKEDGGNRKFILCTNNENNICEDITYQRIKTVITGKRKDGSEYSEGIPANLKYYKTDFISKDEEYLTDDLNEHIKELIQLELGVDIDDANYCLVLSDDDADELEEKIDEMKDLKGIYVSKDVLLTSSQKTKFKDLEKYVIPDCYYDLELKENGE